MYMVMNIVKDGTFSAYFSFSALTSSPGGFLQYTCRRGGEGGGPTGLHIPSLKKVREPEILHPKKIPGIKIAYPNNTRPSTSILIY